MAEDESILAQILVEKRREVNAIRSGASMDELKRLAATAPRPRGFATALRQHSHPAIIAEIKRASPSRGKIRPELDPVQTAKSYAAAGAAALSVLTDKKFFDGHLDFVPAVRLAVPNVPILRKEFIIDPIQVWQTRISGADALLLIVAALENEMLALLLHESLSAHLDVLIEVHNEEELLRAVEAMEQTPVSHQNGTCMLGINNRDLKTFSLDKGTTRRLTEQLGKLRHDHPALSELLVVSESAIKSAADIAELSSAGAQAFLIGEALLERGEPGDNLRQLLAEARTA